jgi:hypothetical protein
LSVDAGSACARRTTRTAPWIAAAAFALVVGCDQFARVGGVVTSGAPSFVLDAAPMQDSGRDAASIDDAASVDARQPADSSAQCARPQVAVCNPVTNEGCVDLLRMHCAVDPAASMLAGYCIFSGPPSPDGLACVNTVVTESCPMKSACLLGVCRTLCFCDADCKAGECCAEPIGDYGFKACLPC